MRSLVTLGTAVPLVLLVGTLLAAWPDQIVPRIGDDLTLYRLSAERWLAGSGYILEHQLAGPYVLRHGDVLYPPIALLIFVPFLYLPAVLWWFVPLTTIAAVVLHHRPRSWTWPILAACLWWPPTTVKLVTGNPVMWAAAALAIGTVYAGLAVFVLIKPSLAPLFVFGIRHRRWWATLGVFAALSALFGPLWLDWIRAIVNASTTGGLLYSAQEIPLMLIPVIAWLGRRRQPGPNAMPARSSATAERST